MHASPAAPLHRCSACGELVRLLPDLRALTEVPGTCTCGAETTFLKVGFHLPIWTVYDHPQGLPRGLRGSPVRPG
jgi:hypothetical protein